MNEPTNATPESTVVPDGDTVLSRLCEHYAGTMLGNAMVEINNLVILKVITEDERDKAVDWLEHLANRIRRTTAADGTGLPPYCSVSWTVGDVQTKAEEMGLRLTDEEADEFLSSNENQIESDMVERGWESIETLLEMEFEASEDEEEEDDGDEDE